MPRIKKRAHRRRTGYGYGHVWQLCTGHDYARPPGFGDVIEAMRRAWPELRDRVFALCDRRRASRRGHGRIKPWGWWMFESSEPRDEDVPEAEQLARMGVEEATQCPV